MTSGKRFEEAEIYTPWITIGPSNTVEVTVDHVRQLYTRFPIQWG